MGLRVRRSIKICKGVRLNVGKKSMGLSFGTKGLRYSINSSGRRTATVGIPGTGISYSVSSGSRKSSGSRRYSSAAYQNRQQIQIQKQQQKKDELRRNLLIVEEYNNLIQLIKSIHKECDDIVDWEYIYSLNQPFNPQFPGPNKEKALLALNSFKISIIERIFKQLGEKRKEKLQKAVIQAEKQDFQDYEEWNNLHLLSERILKGDIDAYLQVIEEMNPLDDLLEYGSDFEFGSDNSSIMEVEFHVKSSAMVPNYSYSLTQSGKLSKKELSKTAYYDIVQDYVCSCVIRIARDIFALLPLQKVLVHAEDTILNTVTGHNEEVTILSVLFDKDTLNQLKFETIDPSNALQNFICNMKFLKTAGFKPVERVTY